MATAAVTGLQSLIVFVVMGLVTLWFTNLMFRAMDILYKPRVQKWIEQRPSLDFPDDDDNQLCPVDRGPTDCAGTEAIKSVGKKRPGKRDMPLSFSGT